MKKRLPHDLTLGLIGLDPDEEWTTAGQGLAFMFVKRGSGAFRFGDRSTAIGPGDMLVMRTESAAPLRATKVEPLELKHFSLQPEHLLPLLRCEEICLLQAISDAFERPRHYSAGTALAQECHRLLDAAPMPSSLRHRSHLLNVAAVVLSEDFKNGCPGAAGFVRMDEHLAQVLGSLSADDIVNLSVSELAERFGCSRRHLSRLFCEHFGRSVIALKMEMRLLKAAALLRDPNAKVINVAEQSGFNHLGLFNTCFKRRFGISPSEWRNKWPQARPEQAPLAERNSNCWMRTAGLCAWSSDATWARTRAK